MLTLKTSGGWLLAVGLVMLAATHGRAQVTGYNLFEEDFATQTGATTVSGDEWVATANLQATGITDATFTSPILGTQDMLTSDGLNYSARSITYPTEAALEADYPTNGQTYGYSVSDQNGPSSYAPDTGTLTFPSDLTYPNQTPLFADYSSFASGNLDAEKDFLFTFSGYTPLTGTNQSSAFYFTLTDVLTGQVVVSVNGPATTTSVDVLAGTLSPETEYLADIDYSNRETTDDAGFQLSDADGVNPFAGLDYNTSVDFFTAVPEPSAAAMVLGGLAALFLARRFLRCPARALGYGHGCDS